jgi:hypothetical protein
MAWDGNTARRWVGPPLACAAAAATVLAVAAGAPSARAEVPVEVEGAAAIGFINAQRAANGLPPIEAVEDSLAEWCPNEAGGAGGSGDRDLSPYLFWDDFVSPWELAPFHEALMYDPLFATAGEVDATGPYDGYGGVIKAACLGMAGERAWPAAPEGYVFYAPGGAQDVTPSFTASEDVTPAERLGLPATTGPNIVAYAVSTSDAVRLPWYAAKVTVSLEAADGEAVPEVRTVAAIDSVVVVPPPLRANERYTGKVTVEFVKSESLVAAEVVEDPLAFTTTQQPNPAAIREAKAEADGAGLALTVTVAGNRDPNAALAVAQGTAFATYPLAGGGGEQQLHVTVPGTMPGLVCLRTYGDDGYETLSACQGFAVSVPPNEAGPGTVKTTTTAQGPAGPTLRIVRAPTIRGDDLLAEVKCEGTPQQACAGEVTMRVTEYVTRRGSVSLSPGKGRRRRSVIVGAEGLRMAAGTSKATQVSLSRAGVRLRRRFGRLPVSLSVINTTSGVRSTVASRRIVFKQLAHGTHVSGN